jgi:Domain of unknown function (DUF4149)
MTEGEFTAADIEPSDEEKRAARRLLVERAAASVAVVAAGMWAGGMVALGACAAPAVFNLAPKPFSGNAMGAAFASFDRIALGAAAVTLAAEFARTWASGRRGVTRAARLRRFLTVLAAVAAGYLALVITPEINRLHLEGVERGRGPEGERLEQIHQRAEALGKVEVFFGLAVIVLHVMTLPVKKPDDDDLVAPLPPGPRDR